MNNRKSLILILFLIYLSADEVLRQVVPIIVYALGGLIVAWIIIISLTLLLNSLIRSVLIHADYEAKNG